MYRVFVAALIMCFCVFPQAWAEDSSDPAYLEAIKRAEQIRQKEGEKPAIAVVNEVKPPKEQMCLETAVCMAVDFSSGSPAKMFVDNCKLYVSERYPNNGNNKLSQEAYACYAFLLSAFETLNVSKFVQAQKNGEIYTPEEVKGVKADRSDCPFAHAESYPELYLDFMDRHPELLDKNLAYTMYLFYEDTLACTVYSGEIRKK